MRACAFSALTACVCRAPGFLIAWASSRIASDHSRAPERLDARQRPVGRDDQIGAAEIGAGHLGQLARGHGGGMGHERRQRRREALDLGLPVGEERRRRDEKMRRAAAAARAACAGAADPAPGWSCRAPCRRPGRRRAAATRRRPATPRRLSDRAASVPRRSAPGSAAASPSGPRSRSSVRASQAPASTRDQPSRDGERGGIVVRPGGAGQQPHALEERQSALLGLAPHALPVGEHLAQPLAVQLDPLPTQPHQPVRRRQELAHLGGRELLVTQRDGDREVEQRVHADRARPLLAHAHGDLGPRRAPGPPPVGDAHDQPGRLEGRDGAQEAVRLGGRPGHRLVDRAGVDQLGQPRGSAPRRAARAPAGGAAPADRRVRTTPRGARDSGRCCTLPPAPARTA